MKKIKLNDGLYTTVDDEDYELLMNFAELVGAPWKATFGSINKVRVTAIHNQMHRILLKAKAGTCVTHINGDGLDNRKENLRVCSLSHAKATQKGTMRNNRSGFRGVSDSGDNYNKRWRAELNYEGKRYRLGYFYKKDTAAQAYDVKAYELMGEAAYLNFPEKLNEYLNIIKQNMVNL